MEAAEWFIDSARSFGGWHVVPGTSVLLRHVLPELAAGVSDEEILRLFPSLPSRLVGDLRVLATPDREFRDRLGRRLADYLQGRCPSPELDDPPPVDSAAVLPAYFEHNPVDWAFDRAAVRELTVRMILFLRTDKPFCGTAVDPRNFPFATRQELLEAWSASEFSRDQAGQPVRCDSLERRERAAELLDEYLASRVDRAALLERWPRPSLELALHRIPQGLPDVLPPGRPTELDGDLREMLCRCRDFLRHDLPYTWPPLHEPRMLALKITFGGCFMCGLFFVVAVLMTVCVFEGSAVAMLLMLAAAVLGTIVWLKSIVSREESPRRRTLLETNWPLPPAM